MIKKALLYIWENIKIKKDYYNLSERFNLKEAASNLYKTFRIIKKRVIKKSKLVKFPTQVLGLH